MKILIISHNPLSTQNNMGKTFLSLFSEFGKEQLCQLYIYPSWPDVDACASYYRITDKDMLRRFTRLEKPGGVVPEENIVETQGAYEDAKDQSFYKNRKNKSALRRLMRDLMWKLGGWYTRDLKKWLDEQQPTCIFVAGGPGKFIYDFALRIGKTRDIPIVPYICDEYYFVSPSDAFLDKLRLGLLKRKMEQVLKASCCLTVISEELRALYSAHFSLETVTLMTGAGCAIAKEPKVAARPVRMCYFGNIRCNRYISLLQIGRTLDTVNERLGTDFRLKIYTAEQDGQILDCLRQSPSVDIPGFVGGKAYEKAFSNADILLHTEAFDEKSVEFVRNSLSTKIADSLASGIPLFAYGPAHIASMAHLRRHDCAITATDEAALEDALITAFTDEKACRRVAENALAAARECHDSATVSARLKSLLERGQP